jgi:hypothetical protein
MSTAAWIAIIAAVVVVAIAIAGMFYMRKRRTQTLRSHFGPEYDRAIHEYGNQQKAEDALASRQKRMERVHIRSLGPGERDRFAEHWHVVQTKFVDDPAGSIAEADRLVCDLMVARGYPMSDFDRRAEDISVDHPRVVQHYRAAHDVAMRHSKGQASTEDLRKAMVYYRDLFDELLEAHVSTSREERR